MTWDKTIIDFNGFPVKVYTNEANTQAIVFPPFGKYFSVSSDRSALDFAVTFIFFTSSNEVSYTQYLSSQEDTSIIFQEVA
jgi:hypothetical protein